MLHVLKSEVFILDPPRLINVNWHSRLAHMRIRYHFMANLHIHRNTLFLPKYEKNKSHRMSRSTLKNRFFSKPLKIKQNTAKTMIEAEICLDFRLGWTLFKVRKVVSRSARSQSWLCPLKKRLLTSKQTHTKTKNLMLFQERNSCKLTLRLGIIHISQYWAWMWLNYKYNIQVAVVVSW